MCELSSLLGVCNEDWKMFSNLKVWVSPTALSDLSLDDIVTRLRVPETVEIAERYRFFKRVQKSEESVI